MNIRDIELLLHSFNQHASNVKCKLTELLCTVSDGRVPTSEVMSTFNADISELRKQYDGIYEAAKAIVLPDELPAQNLNVNTYVEAAQSSQIRIIQKQIEDAKSVLTQFVSVKSKIDAYAIALKPYQTAASALLSQIDYTNIDEILPETQAPHAFLAALEYDNIGASPEGMELMQKINDAYNNDMNIVLGVATKQYYLPSNDSLADRIVEAVSLSSDPIDTSHDRMASDDPIPSAMPCEPDTEQCISNPSDVDSEMAEQDETKMTSISEDEDVSDLAHQTVEERMILATRYKEVTSLPSKEKLQKAFSNVCGPYILHFIDGTHFITADLLRNMKRLCDVDCDAILESYVTKGYLATFEIEGTVYYCPTQMLGNCFKSVDRVKKLQEIRNIMYPKNAAKRNAKLQAPLMVCAGSLTESQLMHGIAWSQLHTDIYNISSHVEFCWSKTDQAYVVSACDIPLFEDITFVPYVYYNDYIHSHTNDVCTCADDLPAPEMMEGSTSARCFCYTDRLYLWKENAWVSYGDKDPTAEDELTYDPSGEDTETLENDTVCDPAPVTDLHMDSADTVHEVDDTESNTAIESDALADHETNNCDKILSVYEDPTDIDVDNVLPGNKTENALTLQELLDGTDTPSDADFHEILVDLLHKNADSIDALRINTVNMSVLARGIAKLDNCPMSTLLSSQIRLATNVLPEDITYTSDVLSTVFADGSPCQNALMLSAYMFAMLSPGMSFDYGLIDQTDYFLKHYDEYFHVWESFKPLFNKLSEVKQVSSHGFSPAYISLLGNDFESKKTIQKLSQDATQLLSYQPPKTRMRVLPIFYSDCFGPNSDLHSCIDIIVRKDTEKDSLETMELVLSDFCDNINSTFVLNESKVEGYVKSSFASKYGYEIEYTACAQALRQFKIRINLMIRWFTHVSTLCVKSEDISRLRDLKDKLIQAISEVKSDPSWKEQDGSDILQWMLWYMQSYLEGKINNIHLYSNLLFTGYVSLDDTGLPIIDDNLNKVKFYEPWRNILRHMITPLKTVEEVKSDIFGDDLETTDETGNKDNLHQLTLLGQFVDDPGEEYVVTEEQRAEARAYAEECKKHFSDILELAYTYNQINETEKETLSNIMKEYEPHFYNIGDYANWRRFLGALEFQIKEYAKIRKTILRAKLDENLRKEPSSPLLLEAERLLEEDENFAVTEEYLTRFESGITELEDELDLVLHDKNYFDEFLSSQYFDNIHTKCLKHMGNTVKSFGYEFVEKRAPQGWTNRHYEDSKKLINNWPTRKNAAIESQMAELMVGFGIDVIKATKLKGKEEIFQLSVKPTAKSMADYCHPIAAFGTQTKPSLNVINLFGNYTERQLIDTVSSLDLKDISIVIMVDQSFDKASRRLIGELFHTQTSGQNPFLLIDRVLFLYLAMLQKTERLPAMLKCTLPYTTYQPFVRDGGSTADEMFCGRTQELATIIDLNGACVVYGGRQLGKTALLERAESRCSNPDKKEFAVYSTIIRIDNEAEVVDTLISDIVRKTNNMVNLTKCSTLKEMCAQISQLFQTGAITTMRLLIDEVDCFLASIADDAYRPIQPLVDLKRETKNHFKFVLTGLHNVCRAKNATKNNGIFGQLGTPLCIKPLSPTDALKLLSRPLNYLGFQIDRFPHLETILTGTNYYPGILQFFGYMLVETLATQYTKYYRAADGNPPFTLRDEQLGAILTSADVNKSIKDKFRWSLELDNRYFMIARCITMLYYMYENDRSAGTWMGFEVQEIFEISEYYNIHCLESENIDSFTILLDEMVDMGILSQPQHGVYRLRRSSFVGIIGESEDMVENDIYKYNEVNA